MRGDGVTTLEDERCANCKADLTSGGYSRVIGVEIRGVYDGILYWECPDCGFAWARVFGYSHLDEQSEEAALIHNQKRGVLEAVSEQNP
jgi:hypothetical protein